jgi:hypothetical protein
MNYTFSDGVRTVLAMAKEEVVRLQHDYLGTEHILLALLIADEEPGTVLLRNLGVDFGRVQRRVEEAAHRGKATIALGEYPYTTRAKKALELSMSEAGLLSESTVGTEHLLLGLLYEGKGIAAEVLGQHGVTLELARQAVSRLRKNPALPASEPPVRVHETIPPVAIPEKLAPPAEAPARQRNPPNAAVPKAQILAETHTGQAIFISYRRGDEAGYVAGRIHDRLVAEFGESAVFKDFDSIPLGVDFKLHLEEAVEKCSVFLAVISPSWHEKLQHARDFVRIEVEAALRRDIPIIPLFVLRATMPDDEQLPPALHPLIYRNGTEIRPDPDFTNDMRRLVAAIRRLVDGK